MRFLSLHILVFRNKLGGTFYENLVFPQFVGLYRCELNVLLGDLVEGLILRDLALSGPFFLLGEFDSLLWVAVVYFEIWDRSLRRVHSF